jgi:hypothetical protein
VLISTDIRNFLDLDFQLSKDCYFSPSYAPIIDPADINRGTCVEDVACPNTLYEFSWSGDEVTISKKLKKIITRSEYKNIIKHFTKKNILQVYDNHEHVYLLHGGGIDSLFLLSLISNLNLLSRTTIITVINNLSEEKNSLKDKNRWKHFCSSIDYARTKGAKHEQFYFNQQDYIDIILHKDYRHCTEYITSWLLDKFNKSVFIMGGAGNHVLLHKDFILKEIYMANPPKKTIDISKNYMHILSLEKINTIPNRPIHNHFLLNKKQYQWNTNGNKIMSPMADYNILESFFGLKWQTFTVEDSISVNFAKELISEFDPIVLNFITTECVTEYDSLSGFEIDFDKIKNKMTIPPLKHNAEGLNYIKHMLDKSLSSKKIHSNVITAIKMLHWIYKK